MIQRYELGAWYERHYLDEHRPAPTIRMRERTLFEKVPPESGGHAETRHNSAQSDGNVSDVR